MKQIQKRYQYWGMQEGKPCVLWTEWFPYYGEDRPTKQPSNKLKIEYREYELS